MSQRSKQRHEAKRKAKRREERRRNSVSPIKRLGEARTEPECWMSDDFESNGQMQIFVYKEGAGLSGMACFLVDRGVVGLKDAWVQVNLDRSDFNDAIDACSSRGIQMLRAEVDNVRRWISGGIRWAYENGMRLPKDWAKPASFVGGVGDWALADVSAFVKEFAGHPEDLRRRLIGESFESYVKRTDIEFIFNDAAPFMDQETGRYLNNSIDSDDGESDVDIEAISDEMTDEKVKKLSERFSPTTDALTAQTASWLAGQNDAPSPELPEAWRSVLLSSLLSKASMPEAEDDEVADLGYELLQEFCSRVGGSRHSEHRRAVNQALKHLETDPAMMQKAILEHGMAGEGAE
jgi:hypothetical protein